MPAQLWWREEGAITNVERGRYNYECEGTITTNVERGGYNYKCEGTITTNVERGGYNYKCGERRVQLQMRREEGTITNAERGGYNCYKRASNTLQDTSIYIHLHGNKCA